MIRPYIVDTQERYTAKVDAPSANNTRNHDPMPSRDLHSDHDQLIEYKHRERNADHLSENVRVIRSHTDKELRKALDHRALVDGHRDPDEEALVAQTAARLELSVELRIQIRNTLIDIAVQHQTENRRHGVNSAVPHQQPILIQRIRLKRRSNRVHSLANTDNQTAMNDKLAQLRRPLVRVPSMPNKQLDKVAELLDAEVRRERGLAAFFADDADAYVGGLDHGDVVAAVADAADALLGV